MIRVAVSINALYGLKKKDFGDVMTFLNEKIINFAE